MGDTMTPREKMNKAHVQALKEYMGATASARRTRTRRKNRAEELFRKTMWLALEEQRRKQVVAWEEFLKEVEEIRSYVHSP